MDNLPYDLDAAAALGSAAAAAGGGRCVEEA
eukprot:CAMPEP_0185255266 /NCGR_PEP_ID=MMETSP1359-20130426/4265_1 /TAXON_ID=552665 /ORGANISM="Bigelowiella longifila, Strain CCMP242" /LENGTH=30 /DNA_ID= /DNA_START= /DNA_END= /DNA_ORIENTATION=